jgi:hypothetical protein
MVKAQNRTGLKRDSEDIALDSINQVQTRAGTECYVLSGRELRSRSSWPHLPGRPLRGLFARL